MKLTSSYKYFPSNKRIKNIFDTSNNTSNDFISRPISSRSPQMVKRNSIRKLDVFSRNLRTDGSFDSQLRDSSSASFYSKKKVNSKLAGMLNNLNRSKSRKKLKLGLNLKLSSKIHNFSRKVSLDQSEQMKSGVSDVSRSTLLSNCFVKYRKSKSKQKLDLKLNDGCYPVGKNRKTKKSTRRGARQITRSGKQVKNTGLLINPKLERIKIIPKLYMRKESKLENSQELLPKNKHYLNSPNIETQTVKKSYHNFRDDSVEGSDQEVNLSHQDFRKSKTMTNNSHYFLSKNISRKLTHDLSKLPNRPNLQAQCLSPLISRKSTPQSRNMVNIRDSLNMSRNSVFTRRSYAAQNIMNKIDDLRNSINMSRTSVKFRDKYKRY